MSEAPRKQTPPGPPWRPLEGKTVVLGVSGGIAAYKAAEVVRLLTGEGARVRCVMTRAAREFIGELTLQALSGHPVSTDLFDLTQESEIGHIKLADDADLVLVAPATADLVARMAAGMADDLLTTVMLATRARALLAPAMNVNMWSHPLVQQNLDKLTATGRVLTVGPGAGFLACGWVGPGRMAEPAAIVEAARRALTVQDLAGRKVVVSAGPTAEPIDPVRYLGNRSSGKLGFALAAAAAARGAEVTLIAGPVGLASPLGVTRVDVEDARAMQREVVAREASCDVLVMAAAVADYRAEEAARKLTKEDVGAEMTLRLAANPDILAEVGRLRAARGQRRPLLIGFAAETPGAATGDLAARDDELIARARGKLQRKQCDLVVANDVSGAGVGFGGDQSRVIVVGPEAAEALPAGAKAMLAHLLWDRFGKGLA